VSDPPIDEGGAADDEPDPSPGAPPHPMDRIWRHPSELPALPSESGARTGGRAAPNGLRSLLGPLGAGAIGALLTVAVLAGAGAFDRPGSTSAATPPTRPAVSPDAIRNAAKRVAPAIVAVRVVSKTGSRSGSGVCIRRVGQVLTSYRLIAGSTHLEVVTSDGTVRPASIIGRDPASDLALLEVKDGLEAADLAAPRSVAVGDAVYAVGADSTGAPWVSAGVVSSLDGRVASDGTTMSGLIESNVPAALAVAGGALLDRQGRVVGILMTPVKGRPTTTAAPIALASRIADGLRTAGYVDHGWLGVAGTETPRGQVRVTALAAGGPSDQAGIHKGDIVLNVDSQPISTMDDLMAAVRGHWPGERIYVELSRKGSDLTVIVRLSHMPRAPSSPARTTASTTTSTTTATTITAPH
jgi:putative serine protease PepD